MALKDTWKDIIDGQSEIVGEDINKIAHAVIGVEDDKEDKANKINGWDEYTPDMDGAEQYPSINMMMEQGSVFANQALNEANAYVDVKVVGVEKRVTTNEQSIAGAFGAIQGVENRVGDLEVAESNLQDRMIAVEGDIGNIETALDNIIAIQNTFIGGGSV